MSAYTDELAKKCGHLVSKLIAEHAAQMLGQKHPNAKVVLRVEGKPGQKKLICDVTIPVVDEKGCKWDCKPHAEIELQDPTQTNLPL